MALSNRLRRVLGLRASVDLEAVLAGPRFDYANKVETDPIPLDTHITPVNADKVNLIVLNGELWASGTVGDHIWLYVTPDSGAPGALSRAFTVAYPHDFTFWVEFVLLPGQTYKVETNIDGGAQLSWGSNGVWEVPAL